MLLLHHDTFLFIPITSDSNNLSELIRHLQQMCFERGTRQSLEPTPRPASHHGLLIFKDTPAGIPPRSTRRKTAQASCSRKAAHDGTPLESLVACLQSHMRVVLYTLAARRALQGILGNERGERRPLLLRPHKERRLSLFMICMTGTAVPLCLCYHRPPFLASSLQCFAVFCTVAHSPKL